MNKISLQIKLVIFTVEGGHLQIFLPQGCLPNGNLIPGESLDCAEERLFSVSLGIKGRNFYSEQLYTISGGDRTQNEVIVVYYRLVPRQLIPQGGLDNWIIAKSRAGNLEDLEIINYAILRLRWKIEYTNVVNSLLPDEFTFYQLQKTYEAILGKELDKRNFHKKILSLNIIKSTGKKLRAGNLVSQKGQGRPAGMFSFKNRKLTYVRII